MQSKVLIIQNALTQLESQIHSSSLSPLILLIFLFVYILLGSLTGSFLLLIEDSAVFIDKGKA